MRKSPPKANTEPENSVNPLMPLVVVELSTPATSMITATRGDHLAVAKRLLSMHHPACVLRQHTCGQQARALTSINTAAALRINAHDSAAMQMLP